MNLLYKKIYHLQLFLKIIHSLKQQYPLPNTHIPSPKELQVHKHFVQSQEFFLFTSSNAIASLLVKPKQYFTIYFFILYLYFKYNIKKTQNNRHKALIFGVFS
jgi:hypothetical protein